MSNTTMQVNEVGRTWGGSWTYLAAFAARGGHIALGHVAPIEGAAVAADATRAHATLLRRQRETLDQLLVRLDAAIGESVRTGMAVNELPGAEQVIGRTRERGRRAR